VQSEEAHDSAVGLGLDLLAEEHGGGGVVHGVAETARGIHVTVGTGFPRAQEPKRRMS
jgi:hypothetical protein